MQLILLSYEPSMRKVKDNPMKPSHHEIRVALHAFCIDTMQNFGPHSLQFSYICFCFAIFANQSLCPTELPTGNLDKIDKYNILKMITESQTAG